MHLEKKLDSMLCLGSCWKQRATGVTGTSSAMGGGGVLMSAICTAGAKGIVGADGKWSIKCCLMTAVCFVPRAIWTVLQIAHVTVCFAAYMVLRMGRAVTRQRNVPVLSLVAVMCLCSLCMCPCVAATNIGGAAASAGGSAGLGVASVAAIAVSGCAFWGSVPHVVESGKWSPADFAAAVHLADGMLNISDDGEVGGCLWERYMYEEKTALAGTAGMVQHAIAVSVVYLVPCFCPQLLCTKSRVVACKLCIFV